MATIQISNLRPTGSELFGDSESYLNELTNDELTMTHGGSSPLCVSFIAGTALTIYGAKKSWW